MFEGEASYGMLARILIRKGMKTAMNEFVKD